MDRGIGAAFDREFGGRSEMGMSRNSFGDSFDRGMGQFYDVLEVQPKFLNIILKFIDLFLSTCR